MMDGGLLDKRVYELAKCYLPSQEIEGVTEKLIERYLTPFSLNPRPTSKLGVYRKILESAQSANMKAGVVGRAIGGVDKLSNVLCDFEPRTCHR